MHQLDRKLAARDVAFGNRVIGTKSSSKPFGQRPLGQWLGFRRRLRALVDSGLYAAMVTTDLAAFFELVSHGPLEERLVTLGVPPGSASELRALLKKLMGQGRGLPQGPDPSAILANAFLHPLDRAMASAGYSGFLRYMDDMYLLVADAAEARRGLRLIESEVRELGLLLQSGKTRITAGLDEMKHHAFADEDEIAGVDYVIRYRLRRHAVVKVRETWKRSSRRRPWPPRLTKFLLRRLAGNKDSIAIGWCVRRFGEIDWLGREVGAYLAPFSSKQKVQSAILMHLLSPMNISPWEEAMLTRALLGADRLNRRILDVGRNRLSDHNRSIGLRQWACILLGRHGDAIDHQLVAKEALANPELARAGLIALQLAAPPLKGRAYADITSTYRQAVPLASMLRAKPAAYWPDFDS